MLPFTWASPLPFERDVLHVRAVGRCLRWHLPTCPLDHSGGSRHDDVELGPAQAPHDRPDPLEFLGQAPGEDDSRT